MTSPMIPVSWGELLDKIAILEIRTLRICDAPNSRANATRERRSAARWRRPAPQRVRN